MCTATPTGRGKDHKIFCLFNRKVLTIDVLDDSKADIHELQVRKTKKKKTLGLKLKFDIQQKVIFINDIVDNRNLVFEVGDKYMEKLSAQFRISII